MTQDEAFLLAIREAPEENGPRLIYADWLEDNGQPERAEFIRVQIELARVVEAPGWADLQKRELALLRAHQAAWLGPLVKVLRRWTFRRGLLEDVTVAPRALLGAAAAMERRV